MASDINESPITVVRAAVLEFIEEMKSNKRIVEQEIRDQTDNVLSQFLNQNLTQYSRSDIQNISKQYREAYLDYYNNTIFLKIISEASSFIKEAIEEGFNNPSIIQDEWMTGIDNIKSQLSHMNELADNVKAYKNKIDEQARTINELSSTSSLSSTDLELYQNAVEERDEIIRGKDQLLVEKEQEIMNLNEGLSHMEDQSNNLGQTLLEYNLNIEDLQETVNDRDEKIERLQSELKNVKASSEEVNALLGNLSEAENTIRKLEQKVSTTDTELVNELEETLEKTRTQLLELRREVVQKNEKMHNLEMGNEEIQLEKKAATDKFDATTKELKQLKDKYDKLYSENSSLLVEFNSNKDSLTSSETSHRKLILDLDEAKTKLKTFEGKVSISSEEKEKIANQVVILEEQIKDSRSSLDYLTEVVGSDIKFKTLFFLQSLDAEIRVDNLAQGIGAPTNIIHRVLIELSRDGLANTRKDGRFLYAEAKDNKSPFALAQN